MEIKIHTGRRAFNAMSSISRKILKINYLHAHDFLNLGGLGYRGAVKHYMQLGSDIEGASMPDIRNKLKQRGSKGVVKENRWGPYSKYHEEMLDLVYDPVVFYPGGR